MSLHAPITSHDNWFVGEDKTIEFTIYESLSPLTLVSGGIGGWTLAFKLARAQGGTALHTWVASVTDPVGCVAQVQTFSSETIGFAPGAYFYTLSREDSGQNALIDHGKAILQGRIT